jgi:hypothetical protein
LISRLRREPRRAIDLLAPRSEKIHETIAISATTETTPKGGNGTLGDPTDGPISEAETANLLVNGVSDAMTGQNNHGDDANREEFHWLPVRGFPKSQSGRRPWMSLIKITTTASTRRTWTNPPTVVLDTRPSNQRINRIMAMVYNMVGIFFGGMVLVVARAPASFGPGSYTC